MTVGGGGGRRQKCRSAASASGQSGICTANVGTFRKKTGNYFDDPRSGTGALVSVPAPAFSY
jgi:hypothetical protein